MKPKNKQMDDRRSTADLIEELDQEGLKFWVTAIAVGFEKTTMFVFSDENNRLEKLNDAVESGGEPIGMVGLVKQDRTLTLYMRPLAEHADEEGAIEYLRRLSASVRRELMQLGMASDSDEIKPGSGWVN